MSSVPASRPGWFAWSSVSSATSERCVSGSGSVTASRPSRRSRSALAPSHSRATSSRSSRSRWRKRTSSHPNSAISRVERAALEQLVVGAAVDDPPRVHDDDLVGERDRREAVGDDEGRPAGHRLAQAALDRRLGGRVDRRGRVVEDQDPRVGDQRPGDRDALALPAGERQAALADDGLVAVGQRLDEVVRLRPAGGELDLLAGRVRPRVGDVLGDAWRRTGSCRRRRRRSGRAARRRRPTAGRRRRRGSRPSVGSYRRASSATRLVLPEPVGPTSATVLPAVDLEVDVAQRGGAAVVAEADAVKLDAAGAGGQRRRVGRAGDLAARGRGSRTAGCPRPPRAAPCRARCRASASGRSASAGRCRRR